MSYRRGQGEWRKHRSDWHGGAMIFWGLLLHELPVKLGWWIGRKTCEESVPSEIWWHQTSYISHTFSPTDSFKFCSERFSNMPWHFKWRWIITIQIQIRGVCHDVKFEQPKKDWDSRCTDSKVLTPGNKHIRHIPFFKGTFESMIFHFPRRDMWVVPPPSKSHHQDHYIFSRESL